MKKRLLVAFGICFVATFVFWRLWAKRNYIEPPTEKPTAQYLTKMFPGDSRAVFENADTMTLYSIQTFSRSSANSFHEYPIVGKTEINDAQTRRDLVAHLYHGVARANQGYTASCFNPRHAIRAVKGKKVVDLVICFSCSGIKVFYSDKIGQGYTSKTPQKFYDLVLTKAGVPLTP